MSNSPDKSLAPGLGLAVAAPLLFAVFDVGLRIVSSDISVYGLLLTRGITGAVLVLAIVKTAGARLRLERMGSLVAAGLLSVASSVCNTLALSLIPLYQAVVILYLYPAFTVALSLFLGLDKPSPKAVLGVFTALVGCVLLVWPDGEAGLLFGPYHLVGIAGSLLYAGCLVVIRRLGRGQIGLEPFLFYCLGGILAAWPLSRIFGAGLGIDSLVEVGQAAALALVASVAKFSAFASVRYLPPYQVGVIGTLEILATALASWLFFSDPMTPRAMVGAVVVIYAAIGFQAGRRPDKGAKPA